MSAQDRAERLTQWRVDPPEQPLTSEQVRERTERWHAKVGFPDLLFEPETTDAEGRRLIRK